MPTYVYACDQHQWDVIKPMSAFDDPERCPECGKRGERQITMANIDRSAASDWNTQTWHPALGTYTRSNRHARQIAKSRGLEEVGNENPDKVVDHFEKARAETAERRWAEADKGDCVAETLTTRSLSNG